jgi:hypothetical protein
MLEYTLTFVDRRTCHPTFRFAVDCHLMTSLYIIINVIIDAIAIAAPLGETSLANGIPLSKYIQTQWGGEKFLTLTLISAMRFRRLIDLATLTCFVSVEYHMFVA